jgi:hypothetical protein
MNELHLSLLVVISIMNSGLTFLVTFSYCPLKSKELLKFFFNCLTRECFKREDNIPPYRVIINDQAADLIVALLKALSQAIL